MNKNKKQEIFNSSFLKKSKKGELTTQQIILLIVVIISFVVILYFLFRLNIAGSSEKEICHNSVVMRGNPVLSKGDISLNCQRTYICLTKDGSCDAMTNPDIKKVGDDPDETYKVLADEMADCWWMFGEGKVDYLRDKALDRNYCSTCTQIAFDESMNEIEEFNSGKISKDELYDYLARTQMSENQETYAEYLFGSNNITGLKHQMLLETGIGTFGFINLGAQYFVVMGIISQSGKFYKIAGAAVILVAIAVGGPVIITGGILAGATSYTYGDDIFEILEPEILALIVKGDGVENDFMVPTIIEANSDKFKLLDCKDILTLA